jgi:hypothetical protein
MELKRPPFVSTKLECERDPNVHVVSVKLNSQERRDLEDGMTLLQQEKESTALKQLAWLGLQVVHDPKNELLLTILSGNLRRNDRLGIVAVEHTLMQK